MLFFSKELLVEPYFPNYVLQEHTVPGTYTIEIKGTGIYEINLVAGGGHYTEYNTHDWDGGYAYWRGYGGGSGSGFTGKVLLTKGIYTCVVGNMDEQSIFYYNTTPIIITYPGQYITYMYYSKSLGGPGGGTPTISEDYTFSDYRLIEGNQGTSVAGDWHTGWGNGGSPVISTYGAGQSGGTYGTSMGTVNGYLKISYKGLC